MWEWVEDCWNDSYADALGDRSTWTRGDCSQRVIHGGSWSTNAWYLRSADRGRDGRTYRNDNRGFRLAQDK